MSVKPSSLLAYRVLVRLKVYNVCSQQSIFNDKLTKISYYNFKTIIRR